MNKISLYLILIAFSVISITAKNYKITPVNIDFNGVISIDDNVVIYGSNGYYYYSEDGAKTWEERKILEQANVKKILEYNNDLYGIIEDGYLIKSTDKGNSWIVKKYDKDSIDKFIAMDVDNEKFFVRSIDKIIEFNLDLEYESHFSDSILFYSEFQGKHNPLYAREFLSYHNNKLFIPLTDRNFMLLSDDYQYKKIKKISECNSALTDKKPFLTGLDYLNDSLMVKIEIAGKVEQYIFLIGNGNYEENWKLIPLDSSLFINFNAYDNSIYGIGRDLGLTGDFDKDWKFHFGIPKTTYLNKYDLAKDTLEIVGNKYYSYYKLGTVQTDEIGANYSGYYDMYDIGPYFINDSTIICVGRSKFIFISYDMGKNWELQSFIDGTPNIIFDDNNYVNSGILSSYTSNGGMTYTPQKIVDTTACHYCRFTYHHLTFISPEGKGFYFGIPEFDNYSNIGFTQDSGKTFEFKSTLDFYSKTFKFGTNFALIGDEYVTVQNRLTTPSNPQLPYKWVSMMFKFNKDDFSQYTREFLDTSKYKYYYIFPKDKNSFTEVLQFIEPNHPDDQYLEIRTTTDNGETWETNHKIKNYSNVYKFYEHNKDSLFITSYELTYYSGIDYMNRVYLYDRTRNELDTLFIEDDVERSNLQVVYFDNNFYLMGENLLKIGNSDLTEWSDVPNWPTENPSFKEVIFNDNVLIAKYNDEIRVEKNFNLNNYYKIVADEITSVEVPKVVLRTYSAYPNPATNIVKAELYWESGFDIKESIKGVYDINAKLVANRNEIKLINSDNYAGTIEWNCSSHQSGLYFIVIEHGNNRQSIPIMIVK